MCIIISTPLQIISHRQLTYKFKERAVIKCFQALQRTMDVELELSTGESKEKRDVVAKLYVLNISSAPVDQDEPGVRHKRVALADNSGAYYSL
jgi:hypothetical protein